ncbi:MAG: ABC transporter ATP-binding protein [Defluviitaleaceae bacterium]|nr:ABC transporter ATP-binding protein [Defluviitaleaceae bacterium]
MNALEVINLNKSYGLFGIKNVSFNVPLGAIMGFVGPNGAGKTTTIKSILNIIRYDSGEVNFFGKQKFDQAHEDIGVVSDSTLYEGEWRVKDVERAVRPFYRNWKQAQFDKMLYTFNIDKAKKVKELSRGMNVKLMIAVALSHDAKLIVLDEPTSGLDPVARDEICELLLDYVSDKKRSILFSTHITTDLEKIADYITFIKDGCVVFSKNMKILQNDYTIIKGNKTTINEDDKRLILGFKNTRDGFDGIVETKNIKNLPPSLDFSLASLDDIVVYLNRGNRNVQDS